MKIRNSSSNKNPMLEPILSQLNPTTSLKFISLKSFSIVTPLLHLVITYCITVYVRIYSMVNKAKNWPV